MNLLLDQNISFRSVKKLNKFFPDCKHVSDLGLKDKEDSEIWTYAKENNYAIVTFDSDFYDISLVSGHPPKIIWLRTGNLTTNELTSLILKKEKQIKEFIRVESFKHLSCLEIE